MKCLLAQPIKKSVRKHAKQYKLAMTLEEYEMKKAAHDDSSDEEGSLAPGVSKDGVGADASKFFSPGHQKGDADMQDLSQRH